MAEDIPVDTDYTEPEGTVTLVSPSGGEYRTHNAVEINNLVYGQGYTFKDDGPETNTARTESASNQGTAEDDSAAPTTEAPAAPTPSPAVSKAAAKAPAKASGEKAAGSGMPASPSTT
jgi:hypothetical protein